MNTPRHVGLHSPPSSVFPVLEAPLEGAYVSTNRIGREHRRVLKSTRATSPAPQTSVRTSVLDFRNVGEYGDLLHHFLKARKSVFIDKLGWNLPNTDGMEFDQYDTPQCKWVAVHAFGQVLGGFRLMPTTSRCGVYSYMLADAQKGMLENLPEDLLFLDAPNDPAVWEASRLFVVPDIPTPVRQAVQTEIIEHMTSVPRDYGARSVVGIVPSLFSRWLRRYGLAAVPIGRKFTIDSVSSQSVLFNLLPRMH